MFEKNMRTFITSGLIGLCSLFFGCTSQSPQIKQTKNAQKEWHIAHLNIRYASVFKATNGVGVVEVWPENPRTTVLSVGTSFVEPDHHGYLKYTVLKIEEDGAVFEYYSSFDHRSFGKNLIEKDSGTFKLKWKLAQDET
jgi:hypothetical protein